MIECSVIKIKKAGDNPAFIQLLWVHYAIILFRVLLGLMALEVSFSSGL